MASDRRPNFGLLVRKARTDVQIALVGDETPTFLSNAHGTSRVSATSFSQALKSPVHAAPRAIELPWIIRSQITNIMSTEWNAC